MDDLSNQLRGNFDRLCLAQQCQPQLRVSKIFRARGAFSTVLIKLATAINVELIVDVVAEQ
jgi:hypothetical protein